MNSLLLQGGRVVDPANHRDETCDVLILDGKIAALGPDAATRASKDIEKLNVAGQVVSPGLIDLHVHFREPGQTAKETIATGSAAAVRGGFTSVVCMPNTSPTIDSSATVALVHDRAEKADLLNVYVAGRLFLSRPFSPRPPCPRFGWRSINVSTCLPGSGWII